MLGSVETCSQAHLGETAKALCNLVFISEQHILLTQAWRRSEGFSSPLLERTETPQPALEGKPPKCHLRQRSRSTANGRKVGHGEACSGSPGLPPNLSLCGHNYGLPSGQAYQREKTGLRERATEAPPHSKCQGTQYLQSLPPRRAEPSLSGFGGHPYSPLALLPHLLATVSPTLLLIKPDLTSYPCPTKG